MKEKYDVPIASESEFVEYMLSQMAAFGLPCTLQQAKDFYVYYARMIETNKYLNLTGITDMKEVVVKHMIDSLSCYDPKIIKSGSSIIDVGTGAGFPGIPLAIYDRSLHVTLFDSLKKRLTFLEFVIDELQLTNCILVQLNKGIRCKTGTRRADPSCCKHGADFLSAKAGHWGNLRRREAAWTISSERVSQKTYKLCV